MPISVIGSLGFGESHAAGTTVQITGVTAAVGDILLLPVAMDNASTSDGYTNELTSITDNGSGGSNSWAVCNDGTNDAAYTYTEGSANAGAAISIYKTKVTKALSNGTITITLGSRTSKLGEVLKVTVGAGADLAVAAASVVGGGVNGGGWGSLAITGLASKEYLFFRAEAIESVIAGKAFVTPTSGFTGTTYRNASTGSDGTSMSLQCEYLIATGTGATSAPTNAGGPNCDRAELFIALYEIGGAAPAANDDLFLMANY